MRRAGPRRAAGVAAAVLLLAGGGWAAHRGLGTCEWLDRWLERSGCVAKARIADFSPLTFRTMVPAGEDRMRIFGTRAGEGRTERAFGGGPPADLAVQLVFDLHAGRETERDDLPLGAAPFSLAPTAPREGEAVLLCWQGTVLCDALRPQAFVLSARSGEVVGSFDTLAEARTALAGPDLINEEAFLPGSGMIAGPDLLTGGIGLRPVGAPRSAAMSVPATDAAAPVPEVGGGEIDPSARYVSPDPGLVAVRASPDGRFVARIGGAEDGGSRIRVFDVAARREVATISTDARHLISTSAAWTFDSRHLVALSRRGPEDENGRDLYVFRLR